VLEEAEVVPACVVEAVDRHWTQYRLVGGPARDPGCTDSRLQRRSVTQSRVIRWNSQVVWLARVYLCEQVLTVPPAQPLRGDTGVGR
jgi:hypothetical protein